MQFTFFTTLALLASAALAVPTITPAEEMRREEVLIAARAAGDCTFASGDPPIPNNSNGCVPNHGLGGSPGVITCKDGVPTTKNCNIFESCGGDNGSAHCGFLGI